MPPAPAQPQAIPIEEVVKYPLPGMGIPHNLTFSPDERHMPRQPADLSYMEQRISAYFAENL